MLRTLSLLAITQDRIFEAHVGLATRSAVSGPLCRFTLCWVDSGGRHQKRFASITTESTTFTMNTGPDFGVLLKNVNMSHVGLATRSAASVSLWEPLCFKVMLLFSDSSWELRSRAMLPVIFVAAKMCPENPHCPKKCHIWRNFARVLVNFNRFNQTVLIQNTLNFYPR